MEGIRIAICDDEQSWRQTATEILQQYAAKTADPIELLCFEEAQQLQSYQGPPLDAVLMDIELQQENGIEAVKTLNGQWPACAIVYVTNHLFYAVDSYQTEHLYFVTKDQFADRLGDIMDKIRHLRSQRARTLVFDVIGSSQKTVMLAPEEILYFERDRRRTRVHTAWGTYEVWDKIGDIEARLPKLDFVRCHNSYIVYLPAMREIMATCINMKNGVRIPISRFYAGQTQQAFGRWASKEIL